MEIGKDEKFQREFGTDEALAFLATEEGKRLSDNLPNDITLLILKGHLLMEEAINSLLKAIIPNYEIFDKMNLRLSTKINLLKSILPIETQKRLYACEQLNKLRNHIAHDLDIKDVEQRVSQLFRTAGGLETDLIYTSELSKTNKEYTILMKATMSVVALYHHILNVKNTCLATNVKLGLKVIKDPL